MQSTTECALAGGFGGGSDDDGGVPVNEVLRRGATRVRACDEALGRAFTEGGGDHSFGPYVRALTEWNRAIEEVMGPVWEIPAALRSEVDGSIESAVVYLETAPRCFRSGYLAEVIMHRLASVALNAEEKARVRDVLLRELVDRHTRGNVAGRLAATVWSADFEARVTGVAGEGDVPGRRAKRMLDTAKHALVSTKPTRERQDQTAGPV